MAAKKKRRKYKSKIKINLPKLSNYKHYDEWSKDWEKAYAKLNPEQRKEHLGQLNRG